jgi:excisionase family DNA binding protein
MEIYNKKNDYYSSIEAANILGVAVSTVQLWTNNGVLKAWSTVGGHRRIYKDSVNKLLDQQLDNAIESPIKNPKTKSSTSIVIVEDNQSLQKLYEKQLQSLNYNVVVEMAADGFQGLLKIGELCPDIIISDLMMPNLDGFQLIKALKSFDKLNNCAIVAVTALKAKEVEMKGGLPTGVELITKPFLLADMKRIISNKI